MSAFLKVVFIFLLLVFVGYLYVFKPYKIKDPDHPRFNPDHFSFSDYMVGSQTREVFRKLFPVGTPKEFVDRVLVDAGGGKS